MREKVIQAARELGLEVDVTTLEEPTRTVPEAAAAVGCNAAEIAKSIVFVADGEPVLAIASGAHRVDLEQLCLALDCAEIRQAAPDEVRAATGFPVGGVPPFGHALPVVLDEELLRHDRVWAAGGDGNTLFEVDPRKLADRVGARIASIAERDGSA
jgi:prolyl-tRNA editing enzyme YbaK/EbsC (Cys-tRNA(Pro) deacylase)